MHDSMSLYRSVGTIPVGRLDKRDALNTSFQGAIVVQVASDFDRYYYYRNRPACEKSIVRFGTVSGQTPYSKTST